MQGERMQVDQMTIRIQLGGDSLEVSGRLTLADVQPLLTQFFDLSSASTQRIIEAAAGRLGKANDRLEKAVSESSPVS